MAKWTVQDIPDQAGRLAVVTGANSGLGLATARELARHGARVVLACRSEERGAAALAGLEASVPRADARLELLDLGDLASVRAFAERLSAQEAGLDLLINNAGIMAVPFAKTADGFESQFGTNHLGHFALTGLLLDLLRARPGARVVTVSSGMHRIGRIRFDNLNGERRYMRWLAYGQSKLANLLFTFELERRAKAAGLALDAYASHPGYAATNLQTSGKGWLDHVWAAVGNTVFAQSAEHGAWPSLYAATTPDLPGGSFVGPDEWMEMRGSPHVVVPISAALDEETAKRLWERSEELTGVTYAFGPDDAGRASASGPILRSET